MAQSTHQTPLSRPPPSERLEPVNVLLVDDRAEDLLSLSAVLDGRGYRLVRARSGAEALRCLLRQDFAVILLDIVMPTMDGFEVAAMIKQRERSRHTPILFMTAEGADVGRLYRAYSAGAIDCLEKPIDVNAVRAKVAIFVDLYRKELTLRRQAVALQEAERREHNVQIAALEFAATRRYVNLAEAIPHIVWTASPEGALDYANRCWVEYTGVPVDEARGEGWQETLHADDREPCRRAFQSAIAAGDAFMVECRLRRADGAYRYHVCRAAPERDPEGKLAAWLGTFTDFEEIKQAIGARDEFMAIASHELRTPLTALKLRIQSLVRVRQGDSDLRERLEGALRQTGRLERLIDNLLDVSRIATGHLDVELEPLDLSETVQEVADRFSADAERAGVTVELDLPEESQGRWDRLRVEQVLTNLLSNAIKYGQGGGVCIALRMSELEAEIRVTGGSPIAPANLQRIFDRFERAGGPRSAGGLGVGLYVTRQIVAAHGGTIEARCEPGDVPVFLVALPRWTETEPLSPVAASARDGVA